MSQSDDGGDDRLEMIAELRRSAERQLRNADQLEAEMRAEARQKRRRFRLIKGAGLAAVLLFLRQLIRHNPAVTATAVLTSAASAAVITAAVVTTGSPPPQPRPTVTAPAPGHTTLPYPPPQQPQPPATPPPAPPRAPAPIDAAPGTLPSAAPSSPAAPSPLSTVTTTPPVPAQVPTPLRRRRRPEGCPVELTVGQVSICPPL